MPTVRLFAHAARPWSAPFSAAVMPGAVAALALALVLALLPGAATAHGPTPKKVEKSVVIAADPAAVWAVVGDFAAIAAWHPDVAASTGSGGNVAGGTRTVTLKAGGDLVDGLDEVDAAGMSYAYRLGTPNIEAFPVSFYTASLKVEPDPGGAKVTWMGRFYRADTGNFPPDELNDDAAIAAMDAFFADGLAGLKAKLEAK